MNYNLSLDLCKLRDSGLATLRGRRCIIIPLEANHVREKDGRAYVPVTMWERTNRETGEPEPSENGSTHYLRLSEPKEAREAMTAEERRLIPYVGNAFPAVPRAEAARELPVSDGDVDDLPFD